MPLPIEKIKDYLVLIEIEIEIFCFRNTQPNYDNLCYYLIGLVQKH